MMAKIPASPTPEITSARVCQPMACSTGWNGLTEGSRTNSHSTTMAEDVTAPGRK